ncbi:hypothetical protein NC652_017423 [Populus alba x Populus x berolinensis]|nr:hypothetical protein NC652_017423 [Populus alba x Populus x berolinensis]
MPDVYVQVIQSAHTRASRWSLFITEESLKLCDTVPLKCSVLEAYIRKFFQYRGVNNLEEYRNPLHIP